MNRAAFTVYEVRLRAKCDAFCARVIGWPETIALKRLATTGKLALPVIIEFGTAGQGRQGGVKRGWTGLHHDDAGTEALRSGDYTDDHVATAVSVIGAIE
jgi:hypothetical protein